ncbi:MULTISPECIES: discoidin domain-containing protein [Microbacterium]|uniref:DUF7402 domain-containing protein n=1 Tax=Microbacterium TaxID=33882 RepID=UPI00146EAA96|nr:MULTISPECIES: discoidin domain-containing protein [Microbacterium]
MRISSTTARIAILALLVSLLVVPLPFRAETAQAAYASGNAPYINTWLLAGPFAGSIQADPATSPSEGEDIGGAEWQYFDDRLYNRNLDDYQDLYGHFKIKQGKAVADDMVAYAVVYVHSSTAQSAKFRIGSSGTHEVWINGTSVGALSTAVEAHKDTSSYDISLTNGWNRVLVKQVKTRAYFWGFYARITDANGDAVTGLTYSTQPGGGALGINTKGLSFTANDMPTAYTEWPYVWTTSNRGTQTWRPQASKFRFYGQGGTPGYTWAITGGTLPSGLTLASDGTIDGTVSADPGEYTFTVRVTDGAADTASKSFTIVVKERPNAWIQHAGQVALVSAGAAYTATFDPNFSADLWAERMKQQGIGAVYFEAGQQSSVWWPSYHQAAPTADYITPYMEAVKRHGIRWGMYYPSEGAGNKHFTSSGFARDIEDLITRYDNPRQWFFDGNPHNRGNLDAMYSIVRAYGDDAVILSNDVPEQGDTDLKVTENVRYWDNALGTAQPWATPDNKFTVIDAWRHPFTTTLDLWRPYHGWQVRDDWRNFAKAHIVEIATGQMADFDQAITMARGSGGGANPSSPLTAFPEDAQKFIDMHDGYATWINSRLEALTGTEPGPLAASNWGFSTHRDNVIYMHVLDAPAPISKTGMPGGDSVTVGPVADTVTDVSVLNGPSLPFTQTGSNVTITTTGVVIDPIDTIIRIETDKAFTGYPLTSVKATATETGPSTAKVAVEGYLNEYIALKADLTDGERASVSYSTDDSAVATVSSAGVVTAVGQGDASITAEVEYDGVTKSDSITVEVTAGNAIRVTDTMIGAVARLDGKEAYFGKLYHQNASATMTIEGRGERGGKLDITQATVTYETDKPDLVDITSGGVVTAKTSVTSPQRVAVWATVSQDGESVTTNKVSLDITDERIVSVGKAATSSGAASGFGASKANDGVAYPADGGDGSKWKASSTTGAWWQVDLGTTQRIASLDVHFNHRNDHYVNLPKSVTYQVSDDGVAWTTVIPASVNVPVDGGYSAIEPTEVTLGAEGRYVRLLFEEGAKGSGGIDLLEVTVWGKDVLPRANYALGASVTASSSLHDGATPGRATDDVVGAYGNGEWVSSGEANPWIKLAWPTTKTINTVVLYDRTHGSENINGGVLTFSDGTSVQVAAVPVNGGAKHIEFPDKTVDWVKFQASGGTGVNNGLSEIQVFDLPPNIAPDATASASSQYNANYAAAKAIDNVIGANGTGEWAALNQTNPWLKLEWPSSRKIEGVVLYDRVNGSDNVNGGTLSFSDGTSIEVSGIDGAGAPREVAFPEKTVTWVTFQVAGGTGVNNGLSEMRVYGEHVAPPTNVAPSATVTASSQFNATYVPAKATDGIIGQNITGEWASLGQVNPWIQLDWSSSQAVDRVVLFDRVNATDDINGGTLTFSDGTSVAVTGIDPAGAAKVVTFPEKTVTWVRFQAAGGTGSNNGLSEIQVFSAVNGRPADYRAMWGFNDNASDNSANDLDATLAGTAGYSSTAPKEGGASLTLDGSSGAKATAGLASTAADNVTLSAWVKWSGATTAHQMILVNGNTASSGYALFLNQADSNRVSILVAGNAVAASQTALTSGQWTHLAAVRRNGTWVLYINGVSSPISQSGAAPATPAGGTVIGNDQTGNHGFKGSIDDVRIYNRALTAAEITKLTS